MAGQGKGKFNLIYKKALRIFLSGIFLLMPIALFAQDSPCDPNADPNDPFTVPCPIDNYVWLMVFMALFAGAIFIYKQQKARARA